MKAHHFFADWQCLSAASRVLVINGFTFNLGFYMLLPYLAQHLQGTLGLSPWHVGLVIGLRVLSQQGLFLIGGTLGDYLGYKPLILLGCLVRVLGFALLAVSHSLPLLLLGAALTGIAGAMFTPSSNAYLAYEAPDQIRRDRIFAMQNWTSEAGMFLGPVLGLSLISLSFMWVGLAASLLFLMLFFIQWRFLPELSEQKAQSKVVFWLQWRRIFANRAFIQFIAYASAFHLFFHQLYLSLPYQVQANGYETYVITWVFMVSSIMGIALQLPLSRCVEMYFGRANAMALGMVLMGGSFSTYYIVSPFFGWTNFILFAVLFSLGSMLVLPLLSANIPRFCEKSELGSYYGMYSCFGGIVAFLGNFTIGALLSWKQLSVGWIWFSFGMVGFIAAQGLYRQVKKMPVS